MMPNACNQDMHEGKRIYTRLYDCLGLLWGEWLSVGVAIGSASQWWLCSATRWKLLRHSWLDWRSPLICLLRHGSGRGSGHSRLRDCPQNSRPFCRAGFNTREIIINIHQLLYLLDIGSSYNIIGSHWPCIKTIGRCLPDLPWPSIGWHRVLTGVTGDPHCTWAGRSFEALAASGPWTTHRFGMILMSFWIYVSNCLNISQKVSIYLNKPNIALQTKWKHHETPRLSHVLR